MLLAAQSVCAQQSVIDSLNRQLAITPDNHTRAELLNELSFAYHRYSLPKANELAEEAITLSVNTRFPRGEAMGYNNLGIVAAIQGDSKQGLALFLRALNIYDSIRDKEAAAKVLNNIAGVHLQEHDFKKALDYSSRSLTMLEGTGKWLPIGNAYISLALIWMEQQQLEQAQNMVDHAIEAFEQAHRHDKLAEANIIKAQLLLRKNLFEAALQLCEETKQQTSRDNYPTVYVELLQIEATVYEQRGDHEAAIRQLLEAQHAGAQVSSRAIQIKTLGLLYEAYAKKSKADSALYYFEKFSQANREWFDVERARQMAVLEQLYESERKDKLISLNQQQLATQRVYLVVAAVVVILSIIGSYSIFRLYRNKQKLYHRLEESNHEIAMQADYLHDLNRRLEQVNTNLEAEVMARTEKITQQNTRLVELAFFAAHNLRAPLARVLGLVQLMQLESRAHDSHNLLDKLAESAEELDCIVKDVGHRIEQNIQ